MSLHTLNERGNQMANNVENVSVGKPKVAGAWYRAPLGTTLPTDATTALGDAFKAMGYVSEDGVTNTAERETAEIKAWGGDTVLEPQTGKTDTFAVAFIESLNENVLAAAYGDENVTGTLAEGMTVRANAQELPAAAWVCDMIMSGNVLRRIVIPNGKVTNVGDVVYKDDEAVAYPLTITAFPHSAYNGDTHREYIVQQAATEGE